MRLRGKVDSNHNDIVTALRATGHSVISLANLGGGVPDLLVGRNGVNVLLEVKCGDRPPSQRRLTTDEIQFLENWKGQAEVVFNTQSALDAINRALNE